MNFSDEEIKQLLRQADGEKHELIRQRQQGARAAFTRFIQEYEQEVFAHAYRSSGDHAAAADMTRDIFAEAYQAFPQFRGEVAEKVWLFRIAEKHLQTMLPPHPQPSPEPEALEADETGKRLLMAYLDGELDDLEAERVEQRLAADAAYRQIYEDLQETEDVLRYYEPPSAPADLARRIYAKIDRKPLWERARTSVQRLAQEINQALVETLHRNVSPSVKKKWPEPSVIPILRPLAVAMSLVLICSLILNVSQYRGQQAQQVHIRNLEKQHDRIVRSGDASALPAQTTFVILTGKLDPQQMAFAETRQLARVISALAGEQEPLFIPGDLEKTVGFMAERMIPLFWNKRKEQTFPKDHFTIRQISVEMPVNANASFLQALQQLTAKPDGQISGTDAATMPIDIYIIDQQ